MTPTRRTSPLCHTRLTSTGYDVRDARRGLRSNPYKKEGTRDEREHDRRSR